MQPQLCSRCKKNIAVVFITRQENGQNVNEGLCLKCAKNLGLPQVDEMMRRMGITDEDLDNISNEMMGAFGGVENLEGLTDADDPDADNEDEDGKTATFPFLSRFFGGNPAANDAQNGNEAEQTQSPRSNKKVEKGSKHKFLDSYCINLSQRARDGKLDAVVGREEEIERVIQILNRRQKNNPCLIGEPGVGKTAIAEGLAQRIVAGDVPFKLRSKEVYLLDLTALVAGTQFRGQFESRMKGLIEEIRRVVSPDTCLLSIMYASNITGSIMDMAGIVKAAREINPDIYIVTDAVQHAPHAVLDVDALGVDGATFAPYKFFGTRGMGYGYVSDRVAKLPHRKVLQRPADVWELGSPTPGNFAAMSAVVDYVCWLGGHFIQSDDRRTLFVTGMEHIHLQERALLHTMLEGTQNVPGLRHIPGVHVYVDTEDLTHRDLIVAMGIDGLDMTRCVEEYQKRGVTTFERVNTSVYSKRIVEAVGLTGAIRVSPLHCHTVADIETYLRVTQELAQAFAK